MLSLFRAFHFSSLMLSVIIFFSFFLFCYRHIFFFHVMLFIDIRLRAAARRLPRRRHCRYSRPSPPADMARAVAILAHTPALL